ncbi:Na+-dependent transporter [Mesorhizobium sp. YM1C-6-2]|uniref:bile acid:sodium symporter family protein n=1 Tax=Mesorhizobium sp. YM1C-6-2 TaxID=1827501 RepID=UPI000EF1BCA8|nr:Na+-dependent transporter [Mesorhizobium sp. YM1C-6-2]RLP22447.1 Na+-dependent transporter [Mesorhizobium sp. YM1C-6-2]
MTLQQLITLGITASLVAMVFSLGLKTATGDLLYLVRRPVKLVRSIFAMNVVMLIFAVAVALLFELAIEIKIALIALAVSPVPPILPGKQTKAGGTQSYALSLLVLASIAAIALVPVSIEIVGRIFHAEFHMPVARVLQPVLVTVIAPVVLGVAVRWLLPTTAERMAHPISVFAIVLLVVACIPVVITSGMTFWTQVGDGVVVFLILFTALGLAVGHLLGGPEADNRTVLALATGTRHPGVAMAIASLNFPDAKAAASVMLWHLVIGAIVSIPYVRWRRAQHAKIAATEPDLQKNGNSQ